MNENKKLNKEDWQEKQKRRKALQKKKMIILLQIKKELNQ